MLRRWREGADKAWNGWKRRRFLARLRPGAVVRGRYTIVKPIGEGSYGFAYLCRDAAGDGFCVLKHVLPLRGGRRRAEAVFRLETAMLERLRPPLAPRLLERFAYRGALCFTMEYVAGSNLEALLFEEGRAFSEAESLALLRQLLDVVAALHEEGIVHRDIRIANVILDAGRIRLIDFGLARELHPPSPAEPVPDDVRDDDPPEKRLRRRIDVTSDFYAMGHLLLFLLYSGYQDGEEEREERSWEEELTALSEETRRLLRRLLLAEQPYASAKELAADLEAAAAASSS